MKERPILFSGPLVRAILDGRKTVTRRLVKPQPVRVEEPTLIGGLEDLDVRFGPGWWWRHCSVSDSPTANFAADLAAHCPHGQPGDRLWVRETHRFDSAFNCMAARDIDPRGTGVSYRDSPHTVSSHVFQPGKWRPSIHMPRWACRIDLEIVSVRAERLQDMTEEEAIAEGVFNPEPIKQFHLHHFMKLWDSINGKRPGASWEANPWVWRIEFRRAQP